MAASNELWWLQGSSGNECWGTHRHSRLGMIHTQVRFLPDISQKMCWDWGWMPMLGNAHLSVRAAGWRSEKAGRREGGLSESGDKEWGWRWGWDEMWHGNRDGSRLTVSWQQWKEAVTEVAMTVQRRQGFARNVGLHGRAWAALPGKVGPSSAQAWGKLQLRDHKAMGIWKTFSGQ